jgi:biopolymer transport protein ExbD
MVNLPKASAAPTLAKPKTKAITIDAQGNFFLDTYPVTPAELSTRLASYKAVTPDLPVIIKGDAKIHYEKVIEVLEIVGKLEITQIGLVTQKIVR